MLEELAKGTGGTVDLTRDPRGERYFLEMLDGVEGRVRFRPAERVLEAGYQGFRGRVNVGGPASDTMSGSATATRPS